MRTRSTAVAVLVAVAALVAACGGSANKAGADTLVLHLASIDAVNNNGQSYGPPAFVDALDTVSGGRLRVEVTTEFGAGAAEAESNLVKAMVAGEVDGGWPSARSFAGAGIDGLKVVEAPMTITNYDAEKALVSGPVGDELLAQLEDTGVVGLSLGVGPLRRPFAADHALLDPADWTGARIRVYNSPVQSDAVRALGGVPVNLGYAWIDQVRAGALRGAEFDIAQYARNGFTDEAGNVTANVVLWPKVFVFSFSQQRWDTLTGQQREWVQQAADMASQASVDATYDESTPARALCTNGVKFVDADADQIAGLRAALQPVLDRMASGEDGALLEGIQGIAAEHPGTAELTIPDSCREGSVGQQSMGPVPEELANVPNGTYRVQITTDDVAAAGLNNSDGTSGTWTMVIQHATYELSCRPIDDPGTDCGGSTQEGPLEAGELRGTGDTVYFISSLDPTAVVRATWVLEGDALKFSDRLPAGVGFELVLEPWEKIG